MDSGKLYRWNVNTGATSPQDTMTVVPVVSITTNPSNTTACLGKYIIHSGSCRGRAKNLSMDG